jgi:hypothetical protein
MPFSYRYSDGDGEYVMTLELHPIALSGEMGIMVDMDDGSSTMGGNVVIGVEHIEEFVRNLYKLRDAARDLNKAQS